MDVPITHLVNCLEFCQDSNRAWMRLKRPDKSGRGPGPATRRPTAAGRRIAKMGETDFTCKRCGNCCLLARFGEVHEEDVRRWQEANRADILHWVRFVPLGDGDHAYEVWVDPATGEQVDGCPWLQETPAPSQYACRIYEARPTICRHFPASRRHAREVGCRGFDAGCEGRR